MGGNTAESSSNMATGPLSIMVINREEICLILFLQSGRGEMKESEGKGKKKCWQM